MSNDEEMAIRGRMMTDYTEAKKRKVILQAERERLGSLINYVGVCMQGEHPHITASFKEEHFAALDAPKVRELLDETKENTELIANLRKQLMALGLSLD
ncbi:MAG: hypothetical protein IPL32_02570 [Chloracidobacterium sp.]|nr:hypothetical protein [Chloracidobacterium sp.]